MPTAYKENIHFDNIDQMLVDIANVEIPQVIATMMNEANVKTLAEITMDAVIKLWFPPELIEQYVGVCNATLKRKPATAAEIIQFLSSELLLSFHKKTPEIFFDPVFNLNPLDIGLNSVRYKQILRALATPVGKRNEAVRNSIQISGSTTDSWEPVFNEDKQLMDIMKIIRERASALCYNPKSVLSMDDDLIRCTSKRTKAETGLSHINNPRKGYVLKKNLPLATLNCYFLMLYFYMFLDLAFYKLDVYQLRLIFFWVDT